MKTRTAILLGILSASLIWGMVVNGSLDVLGRLTAASVDFSGASATSPNQSGTGLPGNCTVAQTFFKTDAAAGANLYLCTAANTWTQISPGGNTAPNAADPSVVSMHEEFASNASGVNSGTSFIGSEGYWYYYGGTQLYSNYSAQWPNIGQVYGTTAATSGSGTYIGRNKSQSQFRLLWNFGAAVAWQSYFVFRLSSTSAIKAFVGFQGQQSTDAALISPSNCAVVKYDTSAGDTTFKFMGNSGSGTAYADSGVAADTNFHVFKIRSDGSLNKKLWLSLDGGAEKSLCAAGCDMNVADTDWSNDASWNYKGPFFTATTLEAATKSIYADYWSFNGTAGSTGGRRN